MPRSGGSWTLAVFGLVLGAFKLWLVARDEIVAVHAPYDQLRFVEMADHILAGRWLGPYDQWTLVRLPGYPLWIAAVALTGVPLRVATELLLIASSLTLGLALTRTGLSPLGAAIAVLMLVLQPQSFLWNTMTLADSFYGAVLPFMIASGALLIGRGAGGGGWPALALGVSAAVLWQTRPERILVALVLITVLAVAWRRRPRTPRGLKRGGALAGLVALAVAPLALAELALRTKNYARYGVFLVADGLAPGFWAAHRALLRIRPDRPRRYVSVAGAVRERAFRASPAFAELRPGLEGDAARFWIGFGCHDLGVCDDIADGWFVAALRHAADRAGHYRSAPETEAFFRRVAAELEGAAARGGLPTRTVVLPYLSPAPSTYVSHVLPSLRRVLSVFVAPAAEPPTRDPDVVEEVRETYDRVAHRRRALLQRDALVVRGWAHGLEDPVTAVVVRDVSGRERARTAPFLPRLDVEDHFRRMGLERPPAATGFRLVVPGGASPDTTAALVLVLRRASGAEAVLPLARSSHLGPPLAYSVDEVEHAPPDGGRARVQQWLRRHYGKAVLLLWGLGVVASPLAMYAWSRGDRDPLAGAFALIAVAVASRAALFTLIDASSFLGTDTRYLYPVMGLSASLPLLLLQGAAAHDGGRREPGLRGEAALVDPPQRVA